MNLECTAAPSCRILVECVSVGAGPGAAATQPTLEPGVPPIALRIGSHPHLTSKRYALPRRFTSRVMANGCYCPPGHPEGVRLPLRPGPQHAVKQVRRDSAVRVPVVRSAVLYSPSGVGAVRSRWAMAKGIWRSRHAAAASKV